MQKAHLPNKVRGGLDSLGNELFTELGKAAIGHDDNGCFELGGCAWWSSIFSFNMCPWA